jgi:hypothetical protein
MNNNELNNLADFFAESIEKKMQSIYSTNSADMMKNISNYQTALKKNQSLNKKSFESSTLSKFIASSIKTELEDALRLLSNDWSIDNLNMRCIHVECLTNYTPASWLLVYRITVDELDMIFQCCANEEEVFNYQLEQIDDKVNNH